MGDAAKIRADKNALLRRLAILAGVDCVNSRIVRLSLPTLYVVAALCECVYTAGRLDPIQKGE